MRKKLSLFFQWSTDIIYSHAFSRISDFYATASMTISSTGGWCFEADLGGRWGYCY